MMEDNVALVTGVSSGIGRETAQLLAERGFHVFGTVRDPRTAVGIDGVELIRLDVTDAAAVTEAVQLVIERAGRLHALVNNAGYALTGALEETSVQEAQKQFDTNFFGVLRVTQAVLPAMRRQGFGRIVNISSVAGFLPLPYMGIYAASKHALEGYSETLDHEVRQFGIRVSLVEPGFTKTKIETNSRLALTKLDAYTDERKHVAESIEQKIANRASTRAVAEVVYRALTAGSPRLRYPVGEGIGLTRLRRFLPAGMFDKGFRKQFHLSQV
jgi:NAD(P)-dependent dehydrogenase (short-subunit alcohol dehydrogenase family)